MALSSDDFLPKWGERDDGEFQRNTQIIPGTCILETLTMVNNPSLRYVFVDDFGYAVRYCRQRLLEDLVPPDQRDGQDSVEQWWRMRSAFRADDLAQSWSAEDAALIGLRYMFAVGGYTPALGDRLREVVNTYGLDLELGDIYVLPQDLAAVLERVGNPFVWWDDEVNSAEDERQTFDFANPRHRQILARRLREE